MGRTAAIALVAAAALSGCGNSDSKGDAPERRTIDDRAGSFRGVGIGDTRGDVQRVFGPLKPDQGAGGYRPLGEDDFYGPEAMSSPPRCHGPRVSEQLMRYESVAFTTCHGRVHDLLVGEDGASTSRGVAVGDPLDEARDAYPGLDCDMAGGGEYESYDYCAGLVGRVHLWFGNDPIHSITLSDRPFR